MHFSQISSLVLDGGSHTLHFWMHTYMYMYSGPNQENESDSYMSSPALRRARFDILYQDCENEIKRLQEENGALKNTNSQLREQLADTTKFLVSQSERATSATSVTPAPVSSNPRGNVCSDLSLPSPRSSPSASKLKGKGRVVEADQPSSSLGTKRARHSKPTPSQQDRTNGLESCDSGPDNGEVLAVLRSKLKQATATHEKIKQDMDKLKEKNAKLSADNRALLTENGRLKQAAAIRSPRKYEKYTSLAQQSKLNQCHREVGQLKSALERSDTYIEELETQLEYYRSLFGSLPHKRPRQGEEPVAKSLKTSIEGTQSVTSLPSEAVSTFRRMGNCQADPNKFGPFTSPGGNLTHHRPLATMDGGTISSGSRHLLFDAISKDSDKFQLAFFKKNATTHSHTGGHSADESQSSTSYKEAHHMLVSPKSGVNSVEEDTTNVDKRQLASDEDSDLEEPSAVRTTPSTALGKLSLDSTKRSHGPLFSSENLDSKFQISPSCHRQLNFGEDSPGNAAVLSSLGTAESHGLMLEDNKVDMGPLDHNATFSDLDFTLTSEISDCAKLMKEAEKRVTQKWLSNQEGETGSPNLSIKNNLKHLKSYTPTRSGDPSKRNKQHFAPVCISAPGLGHGDQPTGLTYHCNPQSKSQNLKMDFDSGGTFTKVTWSKSRPDYKFMPKTASAEPQEPATHKNGVHIRASQSTEKSANCPLQSSTLASNSTLSTHTLTRLAVKSQSPVAANSKGEVLSGSKPIIKPQLMRLRHNTDPTDSKTCAIGLRTLSRLKSDGDCHQDTLDSLRDDMRAKAAAVVNRPGRCASSSLAAGELEMRSFSQSRDRGLGNEPLKRIRSDNVSEDDYGSSQSPTF
ncbi:uncharacterized protein LOC110973256 isoform X3 [Acanthaster planci]|uniref:Uncharacterized protein LOC110973256 isoform X3 n=1 Tax=Acanthaster planci TaxID=133434 RepID=A0A8B7XHE0_ACAPL|nr:uncharacterized protein LOC110973256 isoform X3 [Acanthaster planci]